MLASFLAPGTLNFRDTNKHRPSLRAASHPVEACCSPSTASQLGLDIFRHSRSFSQELLSPSLTLPEPRSHSQASHRGQVNTVSLLVGPEGSTVSRDLGTMHQQLPMGKQGMVPWGKKRPDGTGELVGMRDGLISEGDEWMPVPLSPRGCQVLQASL